VGVRVSAMASGTKANRRPWGGVKGHLRRGRMQGGLSVLCIRCTLMADRGSCDQPLRLPAGGGWVWAKPKPPPTPALLHPRLSSDRRKVIEHLQEWL
jgi:hypothetical protein